MATEAQWTVREGVAKVKVFVDIDGTVTLLYEGAVIKIGYGAARELSGVLRDASDYGQSNART